MSRTSLHIWKHLSAAGCLLQCTNMHGNAAANQMGGLSLEISSRSPLWLEAGDLGNKRTVVAPVQLASCHLGPRDQAVPAVSLIFEDLLLHCICN